jgi:hypothetical protein
VEPPGPGRPGSIGSAATSPPLPLASTTDPLQADLDRRNAELAAVGSRWTVVIQGQELGLRGPLPRQNGEGLRMQRLALGLPADRSGLEQAMVRLAELQRLLEQGRFDWAEWRRAPRLRPKAERLDGAATSALAQTATAHAGSPSRDRSSGLGLPEPLAAFEQAFFADPRRRRRRAGSRTTWTAAYLPYLRRLAERSGGRPLDIPLLEDVLESYALASRSRQQCALVLAALARHQGLSLPEDWSERASGYGLHAARFRQLPSDSDILALVERIPNPGWRLVYGLMATYGLRNHEAFFCDTSPLAPGGDRVIRVLPTSKTGEHQVWPFQPHWVDHFGLEVLGSNRRALPPVRTDLPGTTLQQVGRRVAEQFRRYDLPLRPYDLRHAWAVRTIHIGLPDTVAARMMGHSVTIHTRTYHHWITRRDQQRAVDDALQRQRAA